MQSLHSPLISHISNLLRLRLTLQVIAALLQLQVFLSHIPESILETVRPSQSVYCFNQVGKEGEVITLRDKCITVYAMVAVVKEAGKYPAVAPQLGMDIPHIVVLVMVKMVVVIITALIRTEFFIRPAEKFSSAVKTYSFHSVMFS